MFFNRKNQVKKHLFAVKKPTALFGCGFGFLFVALSL